MTYIIFQMISTIKIDHGCVIQTKKVAEDAWEPLQI